MNHFNIDSASAHLQENWNNVNSPVGFLGPEKLFKFYKILPYSKIYDILSTFESYSLMKLTHKHKVKNPTIAHHVRDVFQIDYIYVNEIGSANDDINYIFCCIDVFSKRAWCNGTSFCNADASVQSMKIIFNSINIKPKVLISDGGSEFNNNKFFKFLKKAGVRIIFSKSNQKASTVERFQKTLQRKIYSYLTEFEKLRYIDVLDRIISNYNNTEHSFLECSPFSVEMCKDLQEKILLKHSLKFFNTKKKIPKLKIGDTVRISLKKTSFHRSYNLQRTYERFLIAKIDTTLPFPRYSLKDELNREIEGNFLEYELVKINIPYYRANVLKTRIRNKKKSFF